MSDWFPQCVKQNTYQDEENLDIAYEINTKIEKDNQRNPTIRVVNLTKMYGTSFLKQCFECNFVSHFLFYLLKIKCCLGSKTKEIGG